MSAGSGEAAAVAAVKACHALHHRAILMSARRTGLANSESCEGSKISVLSRQDMVD